MYCLSYWDIHVGAICAARLFEIIITYTNPSRLNDKEGKNMVKSGFIDKNGDFVIPPQYEWVLPFAHGVAAVLIEGKHGYIDKYGAIVIPPMFEEVDEFSEGLAYAKTATQEGYIDPIGAWALITPPHYYCRHPFCDGLTRADLCEEDELNEDGYMDKWGCTGEGYIDKTGAIAIPPQFREVYDFSEGGCPC